MMTLPERQEFSSSMGDHDRSSYVGSARKERPGRPQVAQSARGCQCLQRRQNKLSRVNGC
eukprot:s272_g6.t1